MSTSVAVSGATGGTAGGVHVWTVASCQTCVHVWAACAGMTSPPMSASAGVTTATEVSKFSTEASCCHLSQNYLEIKYIKYIEIDDILIPGSVISNLDVVV